MGYQDLFLAPLPGSIALFFESTKTKIFPSTTRGGKELPSSLALDSPSVISKLATPKPATAMNSDMSHVIDDATSAMHDTYDETTSMLDTTVPLGEFLDEQIARSRERDIIAPEYDDESDDENMPPIPEGCLFDAESSAAIFACQDRYELKRLLVKWSKESLRDRMRPDPALLLHLSVFPIRIIMNFMLIQI